MEKKVKNMYCSPQIYKIVVCLSAQKICAASITLSPETEGFSEFDSDEVIW